MGNTGWRRSKNDVVTDAAASRRAVAKPRKQRRRDDDAADEEEQTTRAGGGDGGVALATVGTVATVKVVMRRKDAEALAARLNARARKARMAELKGELRDGGSGACWSPQLAPIKEN